jgi:hypothetical protein
MSKIKLLLKLLETGQFEGEEWLVLKKALKPLFYEPRGCMPWTRIFISNWKLELESFKETILMNHLTADELVVAYSDKASSLLQGAQAKSFLTLPDLLPKWSADKLNNPQKELWEVLMAKMTLQNIERERALLLIAQFSEMSNSQSRKSNAGQVAETTIELILQSSGLEKGTGYGKQWKSARGSDTDFIIPWKEHEASHGIQAYIAVQGSSNDRARMASSELHRGAKRFMCSLNGCPASSKNTNDMGKELVADLLDDETTYVVVEKERQRAIEKANRDLAKETGSSNKVMLKKRITWLEEYSCSFNDFFEYAKGSV